MAMLVCSMIFSMMLPVTAATGGGTVSKDYVVGRVAQISDDGIESFEETGLITGSKLSLRISDNIAHLSIMIADDEYIFEVMLLPSKLSPYVETTVVGVAPAFENLASFRIEANAKKIGLMQDCSDLSGKTVLYLGILNDNKNELYYFQVDVSELNMSSIIQSVGEAFLATGYTAEDVERLEVAYLTLSLAKPISDHSEHIFSAEANMSELEGNSCPNQDEDVFTTAFSQLKEDSENGFVKVNTLKSRSLIKGIPDEIYKSGEFDEWIYGWNGWSAKTGYMVYPMSYGLSNNGRLHYVMTYSISTNCNWDTQTFDISFKVTQNCWVLYMIDDDEVMIFDSRARIAVDPSIYYESKTEKGVFTRRYYTITKADSLVERASKVVIGYIPYVKDVAKIYEELKSKGDLTVNKWYPFEDSFELQDAQGKIIKEVKVCAEKLKQIDDYLYLRLEGTGINSINYGYNYSVYDPVWW